MSVVGRARRMLFGVPSYTAKAKDGVVWDSFAPVVTSLMAGYHAAVDDPSPSAIEARLRDVEPALKGFAYEGAGMGLAALDTVTPWNKKRLRAFVDGPGAPFVFPIYIGAGLAYARLRRLPEANVNRLDPLLGWASVDGYGFHEAVFKRQRIVDEHAVTARLSTYGQRVFDQGVGRALWFFSGAVADRVTGLVSGFPPERHADLWTGVGVASTYAGGADEETLREVRVNAGPYAARLARGAARAAWGREGAGNQTPHTDLACEVYCGRSSQQVALAAEKACRDLPPAGDSDEPLFAIWQERTDENLSVGT